MWGTNFGRHGDAAVRWSHGESSLAQQNHTFIRGVIPPGENQDDVDWMGVVVEAGNQFGMQQLVFAFAAPVVTLIEPNTSPTEGNGLLTIHGSNFGVTGFAPDAFANASSVVLVGNRPCAVTLFNASVIQCRLPAGQGRNVAVRVRVGGRQNDHGPLFHYAPPRVLTLSRYNAPTEGGLNVTLRGESLGYHDGQLVLVGSPPDPDVPVVNVWAHNHTTIVFQVPEGQGTHRELAYSVGGQANVGTPLAFSYDAPSLSVPEPRLEAPPDAKCRGQDGGNCHVTLYGRSFGRSGHLVEFHGACGWV